MRITLNEYEAQNILVDFLKQKFNLTEVTLYGNSLDDLSMEVDINEFTTPKKEVVKEEPKQEVKEVPSNPTPEPKSVVDIFSN